MPPPTSQLLAPDSAQSILFALGEGADWRGEYDAFGYRHGVVVRPAFNGQVREADSGCYLLGDGHRAYSPVLRRFGRPDLLSPFGAGGVNAYMYCAGDPVNYRDPSGRVRLGGVFVGLAMIGGGSYLVTRDDGISKAIGSLLIVFGGVGVVGGLAARGSRGGGLRRDRAWSPSVDSSVAGSTAPSTGRSMPLHSIAGVGQEMPMRSGISQRPTYTRVHGVSGLDSGAHSSARPGLRQPPPAYDQVMNDPSKFPIVQYGEATGGPVLIHRAASFSDVQLANPVIRGRSASL